MRVSAKGWAPQQARACGIFFNRILCFTKTDAHSRRSGGITAHCVFYAPPGAIFASRYTCGFLSLLLNLGHCARCWSSAHVSKASYIEAVHEFHQHLRPFPCDILYAQVRRVCFPIDRLHRQLVVADRLLEPQVLDLTVLFFVQACPAYYGQCYTGVNVQPNRNDSTQVFGKRLNSHRLCCCTVASVQFCFGGAGGDSALLLRPNLDQVLPVQNHAPADGLS